LPLPSTSYRLGEALMATRTIWKGAISFGLVHIPVALYTASRDTGIDFDWLDRRSMDPVGYKRVNKRTGREVDSSDIVRGVQVEEGQYVIVSAEEIEAAYPRTTRTIAIERFVKAEEVSFVYLERPYYIEPLGQSEKVYALLRDTLAATGKIGIAKVVIQTRQHLAALVAAGDALILDLMRWGDEIKPMDDLTLPERNASATSRNASERKMAKLLVEDMTASWEPEEFRDEFSDAIMALVRKKVKAGKTKTVFEPQEEKPAFGDNVVDLTELLKRSLKGGQRPKKEAPPARKPSGTTRKVARKA
jgi:DNA end-binding protein Ku